MAYIKGIDVSEHQGTVDWEEVKDSGVGFAMIRAGYGLTVDRQAERNLKECNRIGLPCGAYWFSYAMTAERAAQEAAVCLAFLRPCRLDYPVACDYEYDSVEYARKQGVTVTRQTASDIVRAFCRAVRAAGYPAMNYANPDFLSRYFDEEVRKEFPLWLAQWPYSPDLEKPPRACALWQYSEKGRVPGIGRNVDLDVSYAAYGQKEEEMTGEQIFKALSDYLETQPIPAWAGKELAEAKELGITDGSKPTQLVPRYQAAIMALRAARTAG